MDQVVCLGCRSLKSYPSESPWKQWVSMIDRVRLQWSEWRDALMLRIVKHFAGRSRHIRLCNLHIRLRGWLGLASSVLPIEVCKLILKKMSKFKILHYQLMVFVCMNHFSAMYPSWNGSTFYWCLSRKKVACANFRILLSRFTSMHSSFAWCW